MTVLDIDQPAAGVTRLTLNGEDTLNALDMAVKVHLLSVLRELADDPLTRVILLTGTGKAFCSGGDVRGMGQRTAAETVEVLSFGRQITEVMINLRKPIIAAVNGLASGAGFNLALASDIIVATPSAWFQQSFVRLGLVPDMGGTYLLARAIGLPRAKHALLTSRRFTSAEALSLGFVSEIFSENFDGQAVALCDALARKAPLALGLSKMLCNRAGDGTLSDALDRETLTQAVLGTTTDHRSAVHHFLNKEDLDRVTFIGL